MSQKEKITSSIRSYMRRQGHMLPSQKRALDEFWSCYGISGEDRLDLDSLFGRHAPRFLEIGFGMGDALLEMARTNPQNDYLGVEVHSPGVGQLLLRLSETGLSNVLVDRRDAVDFLERLPDRSLAAVYLFFPDPWLKNRHRKRRLVQPPFVERLRKVLEPGGIFHAATDWQDYARHMQKVLEKDGGFINRAGPGRFYPRPAERPVTKFEQRGLRRGHQVWDLLYDRV